MAAALDLAVVGRTDGRHRRTGGPSIAAKCPSVEVRPVSAGQRMDVHDMVDEIGC
jgi:hypothetical protein